MGAGLATIYTEQRDLRLAYQQKVELGGYEFELKDVANTRGPNYTAETGDIQVYKMVLCIPAFTPENRQYLSGGNKMTEAAIGCGLYSRFIRRLRGKAGHQCLGHTCTLQTFCTVDLARRFVYGSRRHTRHHR